MDPINILIWILVIFVCCMVAFYLIANIGLSPGGAKVARVVVACIGLIAILIVATGHGYHWVR